MSSPDGQIIIQVNLDDRNAQNGLNDIDNRTGQIDKNSKSRFKSVAKSVGMVGLAAAGVVAGIGALGLAIGGLAAPLVKAAAEVEALNAQFDQVFKELGTKAQQTVDDLGAKFGMMPDRIKPMFTQMTSMFKGVGLSTEEAMKQAEIATTAVADAAAFYDMSFEDANGALNSFIKGNYEGGEAIGLFASETQLAAWAVKEGIVGAEKDWSKLNEAAKQTARLDFATQMQKNSGATGQATREMDGLENVLGNLKQSWENLKASLGSFILAPAIDGIKALTAVINSLDINAFVEKIKGLGSSVNEEGSFISDALNRLKAGFEVVVGALFDYVVPFVQTKLSEIKAFWDENGSQIIEGATNAFNLVKNVFETIMPALLVVVKYVWDAIKNVINGALGSIQGIIKIFSGIFTGDFSKLWEGVKQLFTSAIQLILGIMSLTFVGGIRTLLTNLAKSGINIIKSKWTSIVSLFKNGVTSGVNLAKSLATNVAKWFKDLAIKGIAAIKNLWTNTRSILATLVSNSVAKAKELATKFVAALKELVTKGVGKVKELSTNMLSEIKKLPSKFFDAGKDIIQGLINGIKNLNPIKAISNIAGDMLETAKAKWGINSPSRVFKQYGKWLMQGLAIGITDDYSKVQDAVASMATDLNKRTEKVTKAALSVNTAARKATQKEIKKIESQLATDRKAITKKLNQDIAKLQAAEAKSKKKNSIKLASDIKKLETKATSDRVKLNEKASTSIKKLEDNLAVIRLTALKNDVEARKQQGTLSVKDEVSYWNSVLNTFKKGSKQHTEALKLYNAAVDIYQKEQLSSVEEYIQDRKDMGELSAKDEVIIWGEVVKEFNKGSDEYRKAYKNYNTAIKDLYDSTIDINDKYISELQRISGDLVKEIADLQKIYDDALSGGIDKLLGQFNVFEQFSIEKTTGDIIKKNLESQFQGLETFVAEFQKLAGRGINDSLLGELRELGVKALPELIALNDLTDSELQEYSNKYGEFQKLATEFVTDELKVLEKNTQQGIRKLESAAADELTKVAETWLDAIKGLTNSTEQELLTLDKVGEDAGKQLLKGLESMESPLTTQARIIGESIKDALAEGLGVDLSGVSITNPLRGAPLTTGLSSDNTLNGLYNDSANAIKSSNSNNNAIIIQPAPVVLDGKTIAAVTFEHTQELQNNKYALMQTIKGVVTN